MITNISLLLLYLIRAAYGTLAALLASGDTFSHDEIQKRFFAESSNFHHLMQRLSGLSDQTFGPNNKIRFVKINALLLFFFVSTLIWYSLKITGFWSLIDFFKRGLTVHLGDSERDYFLHNWPWYYVDLTRNSGKELYVGNQYAEGIILVFILLAVSSVALSLSTLNTLSLVRNCGANRLRFLGTLMQMLAAICITILIDGSFILAFLATLV